MFQTVGKNGACFIHIVFVADLINALSDPRAYLSNQEKRAEQLKKIGIDEVKRSSRKLTDTFIAIRSDLNLSVLKKNRTTSPPWASS